MATLLHIQSTVTPERSYSLRVAKAFVESYLKAHPDDTVARLDLGPGSLPEFDTLTALAKYRILHGKEHSSEEAKAWKAVETTIDGFLQADKLLLSVPMWNFGIPYRLKQFFDVIVQPGYTFSFSPEEGYKGLVTGRPAMLVLARGGEYGPGTETAAFDLQRPYLETILRFMGFEDIDAIVIEPTMLGGPDVAAKKLGEAVAEAREKAKAF